MSAKKIIYDGILTDNDYVKIRNIGEIKFSIPEITSNHFSQEMGTEYYDIVKKFDFKKNDDDFSKYFQSIPLPDENIYLSNEGLTLYYLWKNNIIYIFSFGEKQPGRYQLYYEGEYSL
jgi:hypothetical protein